MERNRWETAIRCLEIAVHPGTGDDEVLAAVNGFRRTVDGVPLSRVCLEFSCGGVALADLAEMKDALERLGRDNRELRRKLAIEEAAQAAAAQRLDAAYRRIYELSEEAAAAHDLTATVEREFEAFRAAYAALLDAARHDNNDLRQALDEAKRAVAALRRSPETRRPFSACLAEARLAAARAAASHGSTGTGRVTPAGDPAQQWSA